jgi:hypothetical protein
MLPSHHTCPQKLAHPEIMDKRFASNEVCQVRRPPAGAVYMPN